MRAPERMCDEVRKCSLSAMPASHNYYRHS